MPGAEEPPDAALGWRGQPAGGSGGDSLCPAHPAAGATQPLPEPAGNPLWRAGGHARPVPGPARAALDQRRTDLSVHQSGGRLLGAAGHRADGGRLAAPSRTAVAEAVSPRRWTVLPRADAFVRERAAALGLGQLRGLSDSRPTAALFLGLYPRPVTADRPGKPAGRCHVSADAAGLALHRDGLCRPDAKPAAAHGGRGDPALRPRRRPRRPFPEPKSGAVLATGQPVLPVAARRRSGPLAQRRSGLEQLRPPRRSDPDPRAGAVADPGNAEPAGSVRGARPAPPAQRAGHVAPRSRGQPPDPLFPL